MSSFWQFFDSQMVIFRRVRCDLEDNRSKQRSQSQHYQGNLELTGCVLSCCYNSVVVPSDCNCRCICCSCNSRCSIFCSCTSRCIFCSCISRCSICGCPSNGEAVTADLAVCVQMEVDDVARCDDVCRGRRTQWSGKEGR